VRAVYESLRREGHEVTYDWTNDVDPGLAAKLDAEGVEKCDVLILLPYALGKGGAWFEAGMAYGLHKRIIAICPCSCARGGPDGEGDFVTTYHLDNLCVFLRLPGITLVPDIFAAYAELRC
jgi:hypothetical protein